MRIHTREVGQSRVLRDTRRLLGFRQAEELRLGQLGEHALLGPCPRDGLAGKVEVAPEHLDDAFRIESLEDLERMCEVVETAHPLSRCSSVRSLAAIIFSRGNVGMPVSPENQGFATSSGNAAGPSNASISPVLISIFSRTGTPLPPSAPHATIFCAGIIRRARAHAAR